MAKKTAIVLPKTEELLRTFGENIRLARLRRKRTEQNRSPSCGPMIEVNVNSLAWIHAQLRYDARLRMDSPMS